jgi:hypothetical protein
MFVSKQRLFNQPHLDYFVPMSAVKEIEAAIPKLLRAEIEEIREWIDQLALTVLAPSDRTPM